MDETKYISATVRGRQVIAEDLWSLQLEMSAPFSYKPGQYATLAVEDAEGVHERPYSIVSSPLEPLVQFFIELVPHGEVTPRLYKLNDGDKLWVRKSAKGLFTLDRRSGNHNHLFVATVTGLAPFLSMLRTMIKDPSYAPPETRILLIDAGSKAHEFGFYDEVQQLQKQLPNFQAVFSVSRPWDNPGWTGETGRAEELVRKYADQNGFTAGTTTAYLCGHPQMIENTKGILRRAGFDKKFVHEEIYWIPEKETAAVGA